MPLGLDLKGGIHLVLQVVTDDALNDELAQDAERIALDLKSSNIPFGTAKKGSGQTIEVDQVDSGRDKEVRDLLAANFSRKYSVRSSVSESKTSYSLSFLGPYVRELQESTVRQALETLDRRVNALGVTEPTLQIYGGSGKEVQDQIIVELPGIDDPERVKELIAEYGPAGAAAGQEGAGRTLHQHRIRRPGQRREDPRRLRDSPVP